MLTVCRGLSGKGSPEAADCGAARDGPTPAGGGTLWHPPVSSRACNRALRRALRVWYRPPAMNPREIDTLVQRLVANPHDQETLAYAHNAGAADPRSYATLLERVGRETHDPVYASHWLSEAANVWATTLGDAHHAAEVLLLAVVKDPTQDTAANRLAQLYREKGDIKGLAALLEKRAKLLASMATTPEIIAKLAAMHEELGTLWAEPPLSQPDRAVANFKRAYECEPRSQFAIYSARELFKQMQQFAEAIPLFEMEQALVADPERKLALYRDEAAVRKAGNDLDGATQVMSMARQYAPQDTAVLQEYAATILDRAMANMSVSQEERLDAASLFVTLAETYDGENGYSYSCAALEVDPGNDRAVQLATHYAGQTGHLAELPTRWRAYLAVNPNGAMAPEVRQQLAATGDLGAPQAAPTGRAQFGQSATQAQAKLAAVRFQSGDYGQTESDAFAPQPLEPADPDRIASLLESAAHLASKRQNKEALAKYMQVLEVDPASPEALSWVDEHLRSKRQWSDLREIYRGAVRVPDLDHELRIKFLSTVATISEQQLRDFEGAIQALRQLAQLDVAARDNLRRLLEKGQRWDELAAVIDQEASELPDVEAQIALLKKLAALHEQRRKDPLAAGEVVARMAALMPGDEGPILQAVKLFEKGSRLDLAALVIADNHPSIDSPDVHQSLLTKMGDLREKTGDFAGAGEAYAEAGSQGAGIKAWEAAERNFAKAERWEDTARAISELASLAKDNKERITLHQREAEYLFRAGDAQGAILRLEQAADLDPANDALAENLEERYMQAERIDDLAAFLKRRADNLPDQARRVRLRKRAADIQRNSLKDPEAARETLMRVLDDGDDIDALSQLADDARSHSDFQEEAALLHRLAASTKDVNLKIEVLSREAGVLAQDLTDLESAVARYEMILQLEPKHIATLAELANVEEARNNPKGAAAALERQIALVPPEEKIVIGQRLADLHETQLEDPKGAIRALEIVYANDPDDLRTASRLVELCETVEQWDRTAEILAKLIEVEGDATEASEMSRRLAAILHERLSKGQEALAVLEGLANDGDEPCREVYIELGDALGFKGVVATKLREWYSTAEAAKQQDAYRGAFDRYSEMGRDGDAAQVGVELIRVKGADEELVGRLEKIAVRLKDLDALSAAHDFLVRDLSGVDRANEFVRQAETLVQAGADLAEAVNHGEQGLTSVAPEEVEPLLERLAALLTAPGHVIDLYERQVSRCKNPTDRLDALARGAQVAAEKGALDRAQNLFDLALSGGVREETLEVLEHAAAEGDEKLGGTALRQTLANSLASGTHGSRDGGRTRSALLRRAANIAHRELGDVEKAFDWLREALVTHVEPATLDALEQLGDDADQPKRVEDVLGKALEEVFDGPLVRQLVARRAKLRRERLNDLQGAAQDLKKLHDLSPTDAAIIDELYDLLTELNDHKSMVQLLEDQILRGKDPNVRAELARKAAHLWEEQLADPREAADAWRRVLRMKPGDPEAQAGLERAKANLLKKPADVADDSTAEPYEGPARPAKLPVVTPPPPAVSPPQRKSVPPPLPNASAPGSMPKAPGSDAGPAFVPEDLIESVDDDESPSGEKSAT